MTQLGEIIIDGNKTQEFKQEEEPFRLREFGFVFKIMPFARNDCARKTLPTTSYAEHG